ncbi:DUF4214 domain-containing protein [Motiliproteus sp. MSK22-1]|uniref:DUF4214 domain-containing protein n=1 Tax=Motiliproteus sp. MSK22-1 TaxID=1897630 RepID=UPI0009762AA2|nr:DUF4214 domain-containing protein [Motiliproteus sp. MSK22-1]OMH27140.1 hypothetical protein BGP75_22770 [Motiliproteus sp. MSK22-1]
MSTTTDFIDFAYTQVLNRLPDAEGKAFWLSQLDLEGVGGDQMLASLIASPEVDQTQTAVIRLYQSAFDRLPDKPGLDYWQDQFNRGIDLVAMGKAFIASEEFATLYGEDLSDDDYVTALYMNVLKRIPEEIGKAYWVGQLQTESREQLLASFSESSEAKELMKAQSQQVLAYSMILERSALTTEIDTGASLKSAIGTILSAPEYDGPTPPNFTIPNWITTSVSADGQTLSLSGVSNGTVEADLTTETLTDNQQTIPLDDLSPFPVNLNASALQNGGLNATGNDDANVLTGSGQADTLTGAGGNDTLVGGNGADTLSGDSGDDSLQGDSGDDTLNGGAGEDTLTGGSGSDTLSGGDADDTLSGGTGSDILLGGDGVDTISGDEGDDTLSGEGGDDILEGGPGVDAMSGGAGADTFVYTAASDLSGAEQIQGGEGDDTIQVNSSTLDLSAAQITDIEIVQLSADTTEIMISGAQYDALTTLSGTTASTLIFSDRVTFQMSEDSILSGITAIETRGTQSADLSGNSSDNRLTTGSGIDQLTGGAGADVLEGGGGDDIYVYNAASDSQFSNGNTFNGDTLVEFNFSGDRILLPVSIAITDTLEIESGFYTTLEETLNPNTELQTLFASAGNVAVQLTIEAGTAAGEYLLIEDGTDNTTFNSAEDMIIKLETPQNINNFGLSDFLI